MKRIVWLLNQENKNGQITREGPYCKYSYKKNLYFILSSKIKVDLRQVQLIHLKEIKYTLSKKMEMNPYKPLVQSIRKIMNHFK